MRMKRKEGSETSQTSITNPVFAYAGHFVYVLA